MNAILPPVPRGRLRNSAFALVERDFSRLCWGKITPTDIDLFVEFADRLFIFAEAKRHGATMPRGQKLAFERLCDACNNPPHRYAVGCVVLHDGSECFDYAQAIVAIYRSERQWIPGNGCTLREFIDIWREAVFSEALTN
jgi:hypothetical protein